MPGRRFSAGTGYGYGFNGQEKTLEVNENSYSAEYWQYDARIGRRWNVDPVVKVYESGYMAFAGNPIWFSDHNGRDTTRYYSSTGRLLMTVGNGKAGYNRAMVVKDDKVKAMEEYANKYKAQLTSKSGILNNVAVDNFFKSYGDLYDLNSFAKFYEENKGKFGVEMIRGNLVDDMTSIHVDGKLVSKAFIKNLKGAEASAYVRRVGGIFTVDFSAIRSDYDAFENQRPDILDIANVTHIHFHPFFNMNIKYEGKNKNGPFFGYEPAKGDRDGSITSDISQNNEDGRNRTSPRTIVVTVESIRLLSGSGNETIYIKR